MMVVGLELVHGLQGALEERDLLRQRPVRVAGAHAATIEVHEFDLGERATALVDRGLDRREDRDAAEPCRATQRETKRCAPSGECLAQPV